MRDPAVILSVAPLQRVGTDPAPVLGLAPKWAHDVQEDAQVVSRIREGIGSDQATVVTCIL